MSTKIFVNLPVKDLNKSMDFFKALGWSFNPQFTDDTAACLVISDDIYAMLLTHKKFGEFTNKKVADGATAEALIAISVDSKADVDRIAGAAITPDGAVDFVLRGGRRMRAWLESECPALDFYQGFYVKPDPDGRVCAGRDSIHSRSGGECQIDRLRRLEPVTGMTPR